MEDLGRGVLAPGFVNAHAHLELGGLAGRLPSTEGFVSWIRAMIDLRRGGRLLDPARAVRAGAERLLASGTTTMGDIASEARSTRASRAGLRSVVYREVLDAADPKRTARAMGRVRNALAPRALRREGLSPHAPYTTSEDLLREVARLARRRRAPLTVHWAETPEEGRWLREGTGPMAELLGRSPRRSGLDLLERAGLLGPGLSLVHGNDPARGEPARIASAGCVLIHCPGTHAFFGRAPFPLRRYVRARVRLALGTDSLASNRELDLRREMRLLREAQPDLAPARVFDMATVNAAEALGLGGAAGRVHPGLLADLVHHDLQVSGRAAVLEDLTTGGGAVRSVWVNGRRVFRS